MFYPSNDSRLSHYCQTISSVILRGKLPLIDTKEILRYILRTDANYWIIDTIWKEYISLYDRFLVQNILICILKKYTLYFMNNCDWYLNSLVYIYISCLHHTLKYYKRVKIISKALSNNIPFQSNKTRNVDVKISNVVDLN